MYKSTVVSECKIPCGTNISPNIEFHKYTTANQVTMSTVSRTLIRRLWFDCTAERILGYPQETKEGQGEGCQNQLRPYHRPFSWPCELMTGIIDNNFYRQISIDNFPPLAIIQRWANHGKSVRKFFLNFVEFFLIFLNIFLESS